MKNFTTVKIEIYCPQNSVKAIKQAAHYAGAGSSQRYDQTATEISCQGFWKPLKDANPFIGKVNELTSAKETKIEIQCNRDLVNKVVLAIKSAHPYEVPVINIIPLANHLFEM